jgi:hypothetical protein
VSFPKGYHFSSYYLDVTDKVGAWWGQWWEEYKKKPKEMDEIVRQP